MSQNALFTYSPIRLAELSVCNWGSFHGLHTARIDPHGTLVTGDNGAGKSTFIDGLMALLLPAGKAAFNVAAAQGDRSDRSLLSYMRGSYGTDYDGSATRVKSKREKAVITGLRALYRGDDGREITLLALFWTAQSGHSLADVRRLYVVAQRDLRLKDVLDRFGDGNVRELKQWLRSLPDVQECDEHFADYQELYRKYLHMENSNAPALLSRALGLKKIDDLTRLIRELVLEPAPIREEVRQMVAEFDDLVGIHERLADTRAQVQHLQELPDISRQIDAQQVQLQALYREREALPVYFAHCHAALWQSERQVLQERLQALRAEITRYTRLQVEGKETAERRHHEFLDSGGARLEELGKDIRRLQDNLPHLIENAARYQHDCRALNLPDTLEEASFLAHQAQAQQALLRMEDEIIARQNRLIEAGGKLGNLQAERKRVETEIAAIAARPDSNIPAKQQDWRDELQQTLGLAREDLLFIGEMLEVRAEEHAWQGAIERALGGLRTTLLVPHSHYSLVTRWLNSRHMGMHIRVQTVPEYRDSPPAFAANGILAKLAWRTHPYAGWLKKHLHRYDLTAVDSTVELDNTPFSITREGLQHLEAGRFEKKDQTRIDDRRHWYLGFSNHNRLSALQNEHRDWQAQCDAQEKVAQHAREALNQADAHKRHWDNLKRYRWADLDVPGQKAKIAAYEADLRALEAADGDMQSARQRWEEAKAALQAIDETLLQLNQQQGGLDTQLAQIDHNLQDIAPLLAQTVEDNLHAALRKRTGVIDRIQPLRQAEIEKALEQDSEQTRQRKQREENRAIGIMNLFKGREKWQALTSDWGIGLNGLPDYIAHLETLTAEGLPQLVEQFRDRLNKHTTQSLARFKTRQEDEHSLIRERITRINHVLRKTEFAHDSYLTIVSKREKHFHVQEFDKKLKAVLGSIHDDGHEQRYRQLKEVMDILDKASRNESAHTLESLRLLDPRYQLSFAAHEIIRASGEIRDYLDSSSGKSGGEKEGFAGMVVAASLAYVLTPDGHDRPVYSTVFLDEAFSNTAETVSRRVLRVFRELHIHVNLITPYKNLNLARESARSLLIAERDAASHESHLCEITWEELERQQAEQAQRHAAQLGITWTAQP